MNIDFHYGVIYIIGRAAGLSEKDAETVAYACQYVDDATVDGVLTFQGGQCFERFASAHEMFDLRNTDEQKDRGVWIPFHFVPGGQGNSFEEKLICQPDSEIIRAVVREALTKQAADNALHRLGVTLHAYVDTWAHQGFCGVINDVNKADNINYNNESAETLLSEFKNLLKGKGIATLMPLGHGAALTFPDQPWASWHYTNGKGNYVTRENLVDFMCAVHMAFKVIRAFIEQRVDFENSPSFPENMANALQQQLASCKINDGQQRLEALRKLVETNIFSEIPTIPNYISKGVDSWKQQATGLISDDNEQDNPPLWNMERFEQSDYRKFHDAVKEHRYYLINVVLPKYGLRIA